MRISKQALDYKVVVRRVAAGSRPFLWEVHTPDRSIPLQVSVDRFRGMEAAYQDGQAWLADFLAKRSPPRKPAPQATVETVASPMDIPLEDEDDNISDDDDSFDCNVDPAAEASIGSAAPAYPSSIG